MQLAPVVNRAGANHLARSIAEEDRPVCHDARSATWPRTAPFLLIKPSPSAPKKA